MLNLIKKKAPILRQKNGFSFILGIFISSIIPFLIFITILLLPAPRYKNGFKSLTDVENYAKTVSENIQMDTDNTIKPDFSTYYKTLTSTWKKNFKAKIRRMMTWVKLAQPPIWSASFFKHQLETLAQDRQAKGKGAFVCKITPTAQSKIVIFGNVQGAFHSLIRCLKKLQEMSILTDELKVSTSDNFIIFMGDIISRSPFTMETLSLVMKLLQNNPDNVIYLRGNHESNNYWQEHTLKSELQTRASHLAKGTIPLADQVNAFFDTLPLAGYISTLENTQDVIRLSDSGRDQNEQLNEQNYAKFLTTKTTSRYTCSPIQGESSSDEVTVKVIFKGEKKRETYQPHDGLRLLPADMGSTAWTLLSCPTMVYQKAIKFVHDAFVILTPAALLEDWKITLYNRNVQTQDPFKTTTFYLLSGIEEGANKNKIIKEIVPTPSGPQQEAPIPVHVAVENPVQPAQIQASTNSQQVTQKGDVTTAIIRDAQVINRLAQEIIHEAQRLNSHQQPQATQMPNQSQPQALPEPASAFVPQPMQQ